MRKVLQLAVLLVVAMSISYAAPVVCPGSTFSVTVGTVYTGPVACGNLTFSNFEVTAVTGVGNQGRFDVNSITFDDVTGWIVLNGNPNLSAGGHMDLFYTVTGGVYQLDLTMGGTPGSGAVQERACLNPIPRVGISANLCVDRQGNIVAPLGEVNLVSGQLPQPVFSSEFPISSPIYIFKDIGAGGLGGLSTVNQSYHVAVPEPATLALLGGGLVMFALFRRKRA